MEEISGVVVDRVGRPIGGAVVRAEADEFEASCTADEVGRFSVDAPAGESVWVWSEPVGYAPGTACVVAPAREVRITVTPESVLIGRVVDAASGDPIAGATVSVHRSYHVAEEVHSESDEEGRFRLRGLPPGRYEPRVFADDWRGTTASVALGYRETSREIQIDLTRCLRIQGRVVLPEPLHRRGFVRLVAPDGGRRTGEIQDDGSFEIRGVDPGRWQIIVDAGPYIEVSVREIQLDDDVEGLILPVRRGFQITGAVVDEDGRDIEGASVALYHGGWGLAPAEQAGGSFRYDGIRPGRYRLTAGANGARAHAEIDVAVDDVDIGELRMVLARGATIRGRILDPDERPIHRGHVTIVHFEDGTEFHNMSSDFHGSADGTFCFEGRSPGKYTLIPERIGLGELMKPDGSSARVDVDVHAGEDLEIEIEVEGSDQRIEGRVVDGNAAPFPGVLVAVARESGDEDEYGEAILDRPERRVRRGAHRRHGSVRHRAPRPGHIHGPGVSPRG